MKQTYHMTLAYPDFPEGGTYCGIVVASSWDEARLLVAQEILDANSWTLEDQDYETLEEFIDEFDVINEWNDLNGAACPNCTSMDTTQTADVSRCKSCGFMWQPLGFDPELRETLCA